MMYNNNNRKKIIIIMFIIFSFLVLQVSKISADFVLIDETNPNFQTTTKTQELRNFYSNQEFNEFLDNTEELKGLTNVDGTSPAYTIFRIDSRVPGSNRYDFLVDQFFIYVNLDYSENDINFNYYNPCDSCTNGYKINNIGLSYVLDKQNKKFVKTYEYFNSTQFNYFSNSVILFSKSKLSVDFHHLNASILSQNFINVKDSDGNISLNNKYDQNDYLENQIFKYQMAENMSELYFLYVFTVSFILVWKFFGYHLYTYFFTGGKKYGGTDIWKN